MKAYYDSLFYDENGARRYTDFVQNHATGASLIEFACGTGDVLNWLSADYEVMGVDVDIEMIEQVPQKYPHLKNRVMVGDFLTYRGKRYDTAICIGDSTNYILTPKDLQAFIDTMVAASDCIIVDCHHPARLQEFADDYYEEGSTDQFDYAYQIEVDGEHLVHIINFLDGTFDTIYQWVFNPQYLIDGFEKAGYRVSVTTDYETPGYLETGEKLVILATKEI